jgi:intraflagellar transport protein 81
LSSFALYHLTWVLFFLCREEFQQKLLQGHRQTIAPVVVWLLETQDKLKHRIYLARYLLKIEIPPEVLSQDDFLQNQHAQYLELMINFNDVYKSHKDATAGLEDPAPLETRLQQMKEEADTLEEQVEQMRHKIEHIVCVHQNHPFSLSSLLPQNPATVRRPRCC